MKMKVVAWVVPVACAFGVFADPVAFKGIQNSANSSKIWRYYNVICWGDGVTNFHTADEDANRYPPQSNYLDWATDGSFWADGEMPSYDKEYIVTNGYMVTAPSANGSSITFGGKKLILGKTNTWGVEERSATYYSYGRQEHGWINTHPNSNSTSVTFENDGLEIKYGGLWNRNYAHKLTVNGKVAITSSTNYPAWFRSEWGNATYTFTGPFTGAAETAMRTYSDGVSGQYWHYVDLVFKGDMSQYFGNLTLIKGRAKFDGESSVMPGSLTMGAKSGLFITNSAGTKASLEVGSLAITTNDTTFTQIPSLYVNGAWQRTLKVDDAFTAASPITVPRSITGCWTLLGKNWDITPVNNNPLRRVALLDVPESVQFDDVVTFTDRTYGVYNWNSLYERGGCSFDEVVANGRRILYADIPTFAYLVTKGSENDSPFASGHANYWSVGEAGQDLSPETAYFLPNGKEASTPKVENFVFPGRRLVIGWCGRVNVYSKQATFDDLRLFAYSDVQLMSTAYNGSTLKGGITVFPYVLNGQGVDGQSVDGGSPNKYGYKIWIFNNSSAETVIESSIKGDGVVVFCNAATRWGTNDSKYNSNLRVTGDNRGFRGRIRVMNRQVDDGFRTYLCITNGCALGRGAPQEDPERTIELLKGGCLTALDTLTIDDPDRGVLATNKAAFKVTNAADTMTISSPLRIAGTVQKLGAGTLAIGTTPTAVGADAALDVAEGALMAKSTGAFANVAVAVADGAALAVDGDSADVDFAARGFGLDGASITFAGPKKVVVRTSENLGRLFKGRTVAIASGSSAEAFAADLAVVLTDGDKVKRGQVSVADSPAGKTVYARFSGSGTTFLFR